MAPDERILILSGVKGDTRRYRAFHLDEQLRIVNIEVDARHIMDAKNRFRDWRCGIIDIAEGCVRPVGRENCESGPHTRWGGADGYR